MVATVFIVVYAHLLRKEIDHWRHSLFSIWNRMCVCVYLTTTHRSKDIARVSLISLNRSSLVKGLLQVDAHGTGEVFVVEEKGKLVNGAGVILLNDASKSHVGEDTLLTLLSWEFIGFGDLVVTRSFWFVGRKASLYADHAVDMCVEEEEGDKWNRLAAPARLFFFGARVQFLASDPPPTSRARSPSTTTCRVRHYSRHLLRW